MVYGGNPAGDNTDAVRLMIGDTGTSITKLSDAEIDYFITKNGSLFAAAADSARAIAANIAKNIQRSGVGISDDPGDSVQSYLDLAEMLESRSYTDAVEIFSGNKSKDKKEDFREDTDTTKSTFRRGLHSFRPYDPEDPHDDDVDDC